MICSIWVPIARGVMSVACGPGEGRMSGGRGDLEPCKIRYYLESAVICALPCPVLRLFCAESRIITPQYLIVAPIATT